MMINNSVNKIFFLLFLVMMGGYPVISMNNESSSGDGIRMGGPKRGRHCKVALDKIIMSGLKQENNVQSGLVWIIEGYSFAVNWDKFYMYYLEVGRSNAVLESLKNRMTKTKSGFFALTDMAPVGYEKVFTYNKWTAPSNTNNQAYSAYNSTLPLAVNNTECNQNNLQPINNYVFAQEDHATEKVYCDFSEYVVEILSGIYSKKLDFEKEYNQKFLEAYNSVELLYKSRELKKNDLERWHKYVIRLNEEMLQQRSLANNQSPNNHEDLLLSSFFNTPNTDTESNFSWVQADHLTTNTISKNIDNYNPMPIPYRDPVRIITIYGGEKLEFKDGNFLISIPTTTSLSLSELTDLYSNDKAKFAKYNISIEQNPTIKLYIDYQKLAKKYRHVLIDSHFSLDELFTVFLRGSSGFITSSGPDLDKITYLRYRLDAEFLLSKSKTAREAGEWFFRESNTKSEVSKIKYYVIEFYNSENKPVKYMINYLEDYGYIVCNSDGGYGVFESLYDLLLHCDKNKKTTNFNLAGFSFK